MQRAVVVEDRHGEVGLRAQTGLAARDAEVHHECLGRLLNLVVEDRQSDGLIRDAIREGQRAEVGHIVEARQRREVRRAERHGDGVVRVAGADHGQRDRAAVL